ncbi:MAG: PHP domain-containing protein [Legionella sp.]
MIDLHCHSFYSDGELSPSELLVKASAAGLKLFALTDHDTISGLAELQQAAQLCDITIINGVELSVRWKKNDIHIIGLNISVCHEGLAQLLDQQTQNRVIRARLIGERFATVGIAKAYEKASLIAGHERVGRVHYAQLLIQEGYVADMKSAFKRYLGRGRPAYIPTPWVDMEEAVIQIVSAGGDAVIAHPFKYSLTRSKLIDLIKAFKNAGGRGIEIISGMMTNQEISELVRLSTSFDLLASTGSDFHGDGVSRVRLGQQQSLPPNCKPIWHQWTI